MIKKFYDKCVKAAGHKSSKHFLAFFSFIESSFFPIPPDVMIVPMTVAKKNDYLKIFLTQSLSAYLGHSFHRLSSHCCYIMTNFNFISFIF